MKIEQNGCKATVVPETPHTRMTWRAIARKSADWYEGLATQEGVEALDMDRAITDYATISARVKDVTGKLDFEFAQASDSPDELKTKFVGYLYTTHFEFVIALEQAIRKIDTPADPVTAPVLETPDPEA